MVNGMRSLRVIDFLLSYQMERRPKEVKKLPKKQKFMDQEVHVSTLVFLIIIIHIFRHCFVERNKQMLDNSSYSGGQDWKIANLRSSQALSQSKKGCGVAHWYLTCLICARTWVIPSIEEGKREKRKRRRREKTKQTTNVSWKFIAVKWSFQKNVTLMENFTMNTLDSLLCKSSYYFFWKASIS